MSQFQMCRNKVRYSTLAEAFAERSLQAAQRPHYTWVYYDCLWCDFMHIGRHGIADGHTKACEQECQRRNRQDRELRILEGTW